MVRGGKVIGEGGQGCVISPAWDSSNASNEVTKIASRSTTQKETEISTVLRKIDPEQLYGIYALGDAVCGPIDPKKLAKEKIVPDDRENASKCANLAARSEKRKDVCFATYPKYMQDVDLSGKRLTLTSTQMFNAIVHIWMALAFLHEHHVIHGDIKGPNLAVVKHAGVPTFVFADWGWSALTDTLEQAESALESMKSVAAEYIASHYNPSSNGIWSPKLLTENPRTLKAIRNLLEFNDVFSLAYFMIDFVEMYTSYGLIDSGQSEAMLTIFKKIFYKQPKTMKASNVVKLLEAMR